MLTLQMGFQEIEILSITQATNNYLKPTLDGASVTED
jgi:hypothetical protein